ncbi:MAG TPA: hypothetical protein VMF55_04835 [Solirubrobacterales bacterium]|nr:hypothetical protein [Solirubrobacterales bacterium]
MSPALGGADSALAEPEVSVLRADGNGRRGAARRPRPIAAARRAGSFGEEQDRVANPLERVGGGNRK